MTSGITRYTKGAYNQSAILDVYNKAKEIYQDPIAPPSSGVIVNTVTEIWADMHDAPTAYPVASNMSYEQFRGPIFRGQLTVVTEDWGSTNAWFEVEEMSCPECPEWNEDTVKCWECSCAFTISASTNTAVELTPMYQAIRDNGVWRLTQNGTGTLGGSSFPHEGTIFDTNRGCDVLAIETIREDNLGYVVNIGSVGLNELYEPKYYYRHHGWGGRVPTDYLTMDAVYVGQYARLVLKDPNGVDDRHLARFCIHVSSDRKMADGTQIPGQEGWGVGGISRYKMIPTNGDWMPINFVEGWITEAELIANPPPFPTAPAPI